MYYSAKYIGNNTTIILDGEEFTHATKVMRNKIGDDLYVTDGNGVILQTIVDEITEKTAKLKIIKIYNYKNNYANIELYIPNLRNNDRLEFALEKCTELGITNFTIYNSDRSVAKGCKIDRLNKIVLSAMKQSLRAFLPIIKFNDDLRKTNFSSEIILLDQNSNISFVEFFNSTSNQNNYSLIIGPEGGFSNRELDLLKNGTSINLAPNRLRSETACVTCACLLNYIKAIQ